MNPTSRTRRHAALAALLAALTLLLSGPALAEEPTRMEMAAGQSIPIEPGFAVEKIAVGDPEILGVARTSDTSMLVNAKKSGQSNLIILGTAGQQKEYQVRVRSGAMDDEAAALREMFAGMEGVTVKVLGGRIVVSGEVFSAEHYDKVAATLAGMTGTINQVNMSPVMKRIISDQIKKEIGRPGVVVKAVRNSFILDGQVSAPEDIERAEKIATLYSKSVTNTLRVAPEPPKPYHKPELIEVTMQIMELSKSALRDLGVHWNPLGTLDATGTYNSEKTPSTASTVTGTLSSLLPKMRRIQDEGQGRSLMNQAVLTKQGGEAKFFAGTEIPISVAQSLGTMGVEYKKVGMTLNVSPNIDPLSNIDTSIHVESSSIISENATTGAPTVSTNNLSTALNVASGQSIVLGGLIGQRELDALSLSPPDNQQSLLQLNRRTKAGTDGWEVVVFITPSIVAHPGEALQGIKGKVQDSFKKKDLDRLRKQGD
ncbi:MAG TPA: pilus assembly protein N-terminal domain-containing protein [Solidesulfovibrio sp.]|nr:pilus assembly protein N-terminal domain-containing protein [Solidesulfovibrio sp.]